MRTSDYSFTDATGVEWHITGYSKVCGPAYVDCRSSDGKALTVRPVAYLGPSGLSIPEDAPPPSRKATYGEKKHAEELADVMLAGRTDDTKNASLDHAQRLDIVPADMYEESMGQLAFRDHV